MTRAEMKKEVKHLIWRNKHIRIKQTALVEMVTYLRSRIDKTEREIQENDEKIKALKKEFYATR